MEGNDSQSLRTRIMESDSTGRATGAPEISDDESGNTISLDRSLAEARERAIQIGGTAKEIGSRAIHASSEALRDPHRRRQIITSVSASAATVASGVGIMAQRRRRAHARQKIEPRNFFEKARARVLERST